MVEPLPSEPAEPAEPAAPSSGPTTTTPPPSPERFRVLDVADLNGDRVYELVTKSWTDGEHAVQLRELDGQDFAQVADSACRR